MAANKLVSFVVDIVGETSEQPFKGLLKTKTRLTHREQLKQDEYRRSLIGADAANASERANTQAEVFSTINFHLVDAPEWWKTASGGLDLEDDNVVREVYEGVMKAILEYRQSLQKATEVVKEDLQKKLAADVKE